MAKRLSSDLTREGNVGESYFGVIAKIQGELGSGRFKCGFGPGRQGNDLVRTRNSLSFQLGRLFENDMCVGTADPERGNARATRRAV
jgi:hypothetical protein